MENEQEDAPTGVGALVAMSLIQLTVFAASTVVWWFHLLTTGATCTEETCDLGQERAATLVYLGFAALSFAITVGAGILTRLTGRDLMWVPVAASALIVLGYFPAAALYDAAVGG